MSGGVSGGGGGGVFLGGGRGSLAQWVGAFVCVYMQGGRAAAVTNIHPTPHDTIL